MIRKTFALAVLFAAFFAADLARASGALGPLEIARNSDGTLREMSHQDALDYCTCRDSDRTRLGCSTAPFSRHLPTAWEMATSLGYGVSGQAAPLPIVSAETLNWAIIHALNPDGSLKRFYVINQRSKFPLAPNYFWSASIYPDNHDHLNSAYSFGGDVFRDVVIWNRKYPQAVACLPSRGEV